MDLQDQRILLRRIEAGRLQDPALNARAVERSRPEHLGFRQIERRHQTLVHCRDDPKRRRADRGVPPRSSPRRVGDADSSAAWPSRVAVNPWISWSPSVIARDGAGDRVDVHQVGPPFGRRHRHDGRAVRRPHRARGAAAARRALIAGQAAADVVVVPFGEIGHRARRAVDDEQVGLTVGTNRPPIERRDEGDPGAVRAGRRARDGAVHGGDLLERSHRPPPPSTRPGTARSRARPPSRR